MRPGGEGIAARGRPRSRPRFHAAGIEAGCGKPCRRAEARSGPRACRRSGFNALSWAPQAAVTGPCYSKDRAADPIYARLVGNLAERIATRIRARGPITFADYMETA